MLLHIPNAKSRYVLYEEIWHCQSNQKRGSSRNYRACINCYDICSKRNATPVNADSKNEVNMGMLVTLISGEAVLSIFFCSVPLWPFYFYKSISINKAQNKNSPANKLDEGFLIKAGNMSSECMRQMLVKL